METIDDLKAALAELNAQLAGMSMRAQQLAALVAQRDRQIAAMQQVPGPDAPSPHVNKMGDIINNGGIITQP